jgi:hydroxylaminobenzene mutase
MAAISSMLCFTGVSLFLLGLLAGFAVPAFANARLGLSSHLTGVQSGTALLALGLLWPHLAFWMGWARPLAYALWLSLYVLFAGMTLGAAWSTGRALPIAGGGAPARGWQERMVRALLAIGAIGAALTIAAILVQWHWAG